MVPTWMLRFVPWQSVLRRLARAHGFLDPIPLMDRLDRLAQPSEVAQPIELLRAGAVLHARGLVNSRVIQHNLDWIWPYWVERQFDPHDEAFIPRAFSITHINLTNRNWTAVGLPDVAELPLVDPRGLLTPHFDSWSVDGWIVRDDGRELLPSRLGDAVQKLRMGADDFAVTTEMAAEGMVLTSRADVVQDEGGAVCRLGLRAQADTGGWLIAALRPYNPEGISFVERIELSADRRTWTVNNGARLHFDQAVDRHHASNYRGGDVRIHLAERSEEVSCRCDVGMVTGAAMFRLEPGRPRDLVAVMPLERSRNSARFPGWRDSLEGVCRLTVPDARLQYLYDAALRNLILHSPGDVYPGPFTYKRFWFRDAAFIVHALLCMGLIDRAERQIDRFPMRQKASGYFHSQDGEWDSNGEVLWTIDRYCSLTDRLPKPAWLDPIRRGARWIGRKRVSKHPLSPHAGLLPAGFSAEHLGPNDYYYWDDFWSVAGLRAAARLCRAAGEDRAEAEFEAEATDLMACIEASLDGTAGRLGRKAMPASPYRRLDAGAIGSLAAGYPLQILAPQDPRLLDTVRFLSDHCMVGGGFFQDMIHSGINPYLTLHMAQILLRAGDAGFLDLLDSVADLASETGQWPEAIHPRTRGGCMGDGQHIWAAAEWLLMIRNGFLREEGDRLILASGVAPRWLDGDGPIRFGPAPTDFGRVSLSIVRKDGAVGVSWEAQWHRPPASIEIRLPGFPPCTADPGQSAVSFQAGLAR